jgi:hypothetical protein
MVMNRIGWTRYRPTRTNLNGEFSESLSDPITVWPKSVEVHEEELVLVLDAGENVVLGDIMEITEERS